MKNISTYTLHGNPIGKSERFRIFRCSPDGNPDSKTHVLKIANDPRWNVDLDREAFVLEKLGRRAGYLEGEYAKRPGAKPTSLLNYQISFPRLVESFVSGDPEHAGLAVTVVDFAESCEELSELAPVRFIAERDRCRVDAGTSVWILGKLLKVLAFAHSEGVSVGAVTSGNVMVHRDRHYVVVFDWSLAEVHPDGVPSESRCEEISEAARIAIGALGGDPDEGTIPPDDDLADDRYAEMLRDLASGRIGDALKAHGDFYELVDLIWKRGFRPYTTHPLRR
jgi:hypothetical protein